MPRLTSAIELTPLRDVPDDRLVFDSDRPGAALLEGWSDEGAWRVLLPWPEKTRTLSWDDAHQWPRVIEELEHDVAIVDDAPIDAPFLGGWVGFVTYEAAATIEDVRPRDERSAEGAGFFARHRAGVVIDPQGRAFGFGETERRLSSRPAVRPPAASRGARDAGRLKAGAPLHDSLGDGKHREAVHRIREAILDGDVYQVNLTRAFSVDRACDAGELYRALVGWPPPRMSAFIRTPACAIASASPEVLLRFDRVNGIAETRPIKGTIKREGDDAREIERLLASEKDAAEHLMIVDVSRNDLGKVAPAGQVSVTDYRRVQTLAHVHHLESTVTATGLRDRSAAEVLAALSPAASITGAPKRAAVQMIRDLEPEARGVYCGSIGFIGHRFVEWSVAIRTAIATRDSIRYHAGGGIVWDSDADAENEETLAKSEAFLRFAGVSR